MGQSGEILTIFALKWFFVLVFQPIQWNVAAKVEFWLKMDTKNHFKAKMVKILPLCPTVKNTISSKLFLVHSSVTLGQKCAKFGWKIYWKMTKSYQVLYRNITMGRFCKKTSEFFLICHFWFFKEIFIRNFKKKP